MRTTLRTALLGLALALCGGCGNKSSTQNAMESVPEGGITIDADVPGTKVFLKDKLLGSVPVRLTASDLTALSLPCHGEKKVALGSDGWCESLFLGIEDEREYKLHLQAPNSDNYLKVPTPWGQRSKHAGGTASHVGNYFKARMYRRDSENISLSMEVLERTRSEVKLQIAATNTSGSNMSGHRPELRFLWGGMDTPWRSRDAHVVEMPAAWSSFPSRESRTFTVRLPVRYRDDGTSLFCILDLFAGNSGGQLIDKGAIYADSIWLPPLQLR